MRNLRFQAVQTWARKNFGLTVEKKHPQKMEGIVYHYKVYSDGGMVEDCHTLWDVMVVVKSWPSAESLEK